MDFQEILIPLHDQQVKLRLPGERPEPRDRISCWWHVTPAAVGLAERLVETGDLVGKRVIELGCGLGLPGVTAALLGADVLFTDYMPEALELARENTRLNDLPERMVDFRVLDWESPPELPLFDIIMGTEILYDYFFHGSLLKLLQRIPAPSGVVLLADRKRLVVSRFIGRMLRSGFASAEARKLVKMKGAPVREIDIFCLTRSDDTSPTALATSR